MGKTARDEIEAKLDQLQTEYDRKLDALGDEVLKRFVEPACKRHKLTFSSGMGTYSFYDLEGNPIDEDSARAYGYALALRAYEVLDFDVDNRGNLGVWVGDCRPDLKR